MSDANLKNCVLDIDKWTELQSIAINIINYITQ